MVLAFVVDERLVTTLGNSRVAVGRQEKRWMSAAVRRKISVAAKVRWAKWKKER